MREGILNIDKPAQMTSHDVVDRVRKKFNMKRVGHAGTLDPLATGVLVVLLGRATKLSNEFTNFDKGYKTTLLLGARTDTLDIDGKILEEKQVDVSCEQFETALLSYKGSINQMVPMYSAVKVNGRKLYEYARKGMDVERPVRKVRINTIELLDFRPPYVDIYVHCSKGTYIRQLVEDIGNDLGCGACVAVLRRTEVGPFTIEDAAGLEDINEDSIRDWAAYKTT